jgi:hypothetical protein
MAGTRQAIAIARRISLLIETFESFIRNKLPRVTVNRLQQRVAPL